MILKAVKGTVWLLVGAAVGFLGLQAYLWHNPPLKRLTAWRVQQPAYDALQSDLAGDLPLALVPLPPGGIVGPRPTERQVKKLEKKLGEPLPPGPLLAVVEIEKLPEGGTAVVSLEPIVGTDRAEAKVRIYPSKIKFFGWELERSLGIYYGQSFGALKGRVVQVEFTQSLVRTGPVVWEAKAGTLLTPLGTAGYVTVGGKIRF